MQVNIEHANNSAKLRVSFRGCEDMRGGMRATAVIPATKITNNTQKYWFRTYFFGKGSGVQPERLRVIGGPGPLNVELMMAARNRIINAMSLHM